MDIPTLTIVEKRDYRCFRKLLIKNGFIMLQESVYCNMITSPSVENSVKNLIYKNKPAEGLVQILTITEKQFVKMDYVVGENTSNVIDSEERGAFYEISDSFSRFSDSMRMRKML